MAATVAAAKAPAAVVLLGEDHIAFGRIVKIAGLERLGSKGGEARVGGRRHKKTITTKVLGNVANARCQIRS